MAALKIKEDSSGRLVMQSHVLPSWGNIFSTVIWIVIFAFFFLPSLGEGNVDWANLGLILFFLVVTVGGSVVSSLLSTQVAVDHTSRAVTITRRLFGYPVRSTVLPFGDLANIEYQYYRQSSGRYSHDAWRVNAVAKDGQRIPLNWDGKQDEMLMLAQKLAERTRLELLDSSTKPTSAAQQIFDTIRGQSSENEVEPEMEMPSQADSHAPPPVAEPSWSMPMNESPQPELAPAESAPMEVPPAAPVRNLSVAELEKRVAGDSMDAQARYALARKHHARGQVDRAIELYQETLRIDTSNAEAQNDLGVALQQRGKRAEAEAAYRRAVALDPFSSTAHLNLGMMLRAMNRASDASQEFYQARQNARGDAQSRAAEAASTGAKMEPQLSKT